MKFNIALTLKLVALTLATATFADAQTKPSIPAWVRPGVEVAYQSGMRTLGLYPAAVTVVETSTVKADGNGTVSGSTNVRIDGSFSENYQWICAATGAYNGYPAQFWVDIKDPTGSIHGPNGEPYSIVASNALTVAGKTWNSTTMAYTNPASKVQYVVIFDNATGLILASSESTPAQVIVRTLSSALGY